MEILSYFFYIFNTVFNIFIGFFVRVGIFSSSISHPVNEYDADGNALIISRQIMISAIDRIREAGVSFLGTALYISIAVAIVSSLAVVFGTKKKWIKGISIGTFFLSVILFAAIMYVALSL